MRFRLLAELADLAVAEKKSISVLMIGEQARESGEG